MSQIENISGLQSILEAVNALPEAGGGGLPDRCEIHISYTLARSSAELVCMTSCDDDGSANYTGNINLDPSITTNKTQTNFDATNIICGSTIILFCAGMTIPHESDVTVEGGVEFIKIMDTASGYIIVFKAPNTAGAIGSINIS